MKLNISKSFGVVSGEDRARFEQDGRAFDADGDEIVAAPVPAPYDSATLEPGDIPAATKTEEKKPGRKPAAVPAETPAVSDSPIDAQLAAQGA